MNFKRKIIAVGLVVFSFFSIFIGGRSLFFLKEHHRFPFRSDNPNFNTPDLIAYQGSFLNYYLMLGIACVVLAISVSILWKMLTGEDSES